MKKNREVLIIYTGGTIGMFHDEITHTLKPFDFDHISKRVPELNQFDFGIKTISFSPVIDSADMQPAIWIQLAEIIERHYADYVGFVILHGTDTMAYTASALSFLLHNLKKPVILTGSQLPIDTIRNDGKENLITALEIAAYYVNEEAVIQEVAICFQDRLYRGNRTTKYNAEQFEAFKSANFPALALIGIDINFQKDFLFKQENNENRPFSISRIMDSGVSILKLFPGIELSDIEHYLSNPRLKAVVLETYGSGNAPNLLGLSSLIKSKISSGLIVVNVTQCLAGSVKMEQYATGTHLLEAGVVSAGDMTTEATITKLMYLLGQGLSRDELYTNLRKSLKGEKY